MKKFIFTIMSLGFIISLSACGGSSSNDTSEDTTNTTNNSDTFQITASVFEDLNQNQVLDSDENGIENIVIIYDGGSVSTNASGDFTIEATAEITIEVDPSSLPDGYMLTSENDVQTIGINGTGEDIGYAPSVSQEDISIQRILDANHDNIKTYEFDLYLNSNGMEMGNLHYATDGVNFIAEDDNMITYYLSESGKMGVYTKASNQLVITPAIEVATIETPFTLTSDLDPETFDQMYYKGTTTFDDKTVYIFQNVMPAYNTELYVWPEYDLIIHMSSDVNGYSAILEFQNLKINELDESAFDFPEGAEILDMTSMGN